MIGETRIAEGVTARGMLECPLRNAKNSPHKPPGQEAIPGSQEEKKR
jgi:hypothetical protein